MESKAKGFFLVTVLVAVGLFLWSAMSGGLGDGALAGEAVAGPYCINETDGGFNPNLSGSLYLPKPDVYAEDNCFEEEVINELFCVKNKLNTIKYNCANDGFICDRGECKDSSKLPDLELYPGNSTMVIGNVSIHTLANGSWVSINASNINFGLSINNTIEITNASATGEYHHRVITSFESPESVDIDFMELEIEGEMNLQPGSAETYNVLNQEWFVSEAELIAEWKNYYWDQYVAMFEELINGNDVEFDIDYYIDDQDSIREIDESNNKGSFSVIVYSEYFENETIVS